MRYIAFFTLIYLLITFQFLFAQPPDTLWTKTYGEGVGQCLIETSDNCYIVVGYSDVDDGGDLRIIKTNSDGDTIWTKTYGDTSYDDFGYSIRQTSDDGFIIVGSTASFGAGEQDIWLLKTDEYGDTLWTKTFGGDSSDVGKCIQITNDNGFIIVGSTKSYGVADEDVWLIKTNLNGDTLWTKIYGDSSGRQGNYVIQTSDSGYAIVGGDYIWFAKTSSNGDLQMIRTYDPPPLWSSWTLGRSVLETNDGFVISYSEFLMDLTGGLIRTDSSGDTLWTGSTVGESRSICRTFDDQYLAGGHSWSMMGGVEWSTSLELFDGNGNQVWEVWLPEWLRPRSLIQTSDNSFVFTGYQYFYNFPQPDERKISITKLGTITGLKKSGVNITESFYLYQNYPNPFNPSTTIKFDLPKTSEVSLKVFNILGEEVTTLVSDRLSTGSYSYEWDASSLASGVYLYRLHTDSYVKTMKMILMK